MSPRFATLIFVGPGELESSRLKEVVTSLFRFEPGCCELVLINDGMACTRQQVEGWIPKNCKLTILRNPRNGVGDGWADGLVVGLIAGLKHLSMRDDLYFVLRLDTDSVVFGQFSERIGTFFQKHPGCGLIGTFRKFPNGEERIKPGFMVERQTNPYLLSRFLARLMLQTWKPSLILTALRRRSIFLEAERRGYKKGEYVQGGGHALSADFLHTASANLLLDDPFLFFYARVGDDLALTVLCFALCFTALDYNGPGEVFAVKNNGLPDSPDALVREGYAIAHSVKGDDRWREDAIRERFAKLSYAAANEAGRPQPAPAQIPDRLSSQR